MDQLRATQHLQDHARHRRTRTTRATRSPPAGRASASSSRPTSTTSARAATSAKSSCSSTAPTRPSARRRSPRSTALVADDEPRATTRAARRRGAPAARGAADHPLQPRRPHRELHHPRAWSRSCSRSSRIVLTAVAIVREREQGTLEQLLVTPINPLGLMLGKLAPYLFIGLVEMALILVACASASACRSAATSLPLRDGARLPLRAALARASSSRRARRRRRRRSRWRRCSFCRRSSSRGYIFPLGGPAARAATDRPLLPATHMVDDHARRRAARRRPMGAVAQRPGAHRHQRRPGGAERAALQEGRAVKAA